MEQLNKRQPRKPEQDYDYTIVKQIEQTTNNRKTNQSKNTFLQGREQEDVIQV